MSKRKERDDFPGSLFPFQRSVVKQAVAKGRAAIFADTGLGKTRMLLCWLELVLREEQKSQTGQPRMGLIVTPLSTCRQIVDEAAGMGLNAIVEKRAMMPRDEDLEDPKYDGRPLIAVTNYERLKGFNLSRFHAVALDESGVLRDAGGAIASLIISGCATVPYRLSLRAPPSPDDLDELISQAVFLGRGTRDGLIAEYMHVKGRRLFLKYEDAFFDFVCDWSCWIRTPSDVGFPGDDVRYALPGIDYREEIVPSPGKNVKSGRRDVEKDGLLHRIGAAIRLANACDSPAIVWCIGNDESTQLANGIEGAVELRGGSSIERKEEILAAFAYGTPYNGRMIKVLVAKTSICGLGVNLQRVHRQIFCTIADNATTFYQSVRRSYRFGQDRRVLITVVRSEAEADKLTPMLARRGAIEASWDKLAVISRSAWGAGEIQT